MHTPRASRNDALVRRFNWLEGGSRRCSKMGAAVSSKGACGWYRGGRVWFNSGAESCESSQGAERECKPKNASRCFFITIMTVTRKKSIDVSHRTMNVAFNRSSPMSDKAALGRKKPMV